MEHSIHITIKSILSNLSLKPMHPFWFYVWMIDLPFPAYHGHCLLFIIWAGMVHCKAGGSVPQAHSPRSTRAQRRQGGQVLMTGEFRTPHNHMPPLQRACHLKGTALRNYLVFSPMHNLLPLAPFSKPGKSPPGSHT